jgi:septum site-determining protein MinC
MAKPRVRFAGTEQGLLMRMEWDVPLPQLLVEVEEHLQQSPTFFAGAHVLLEVGNRPLLQSDVEQLAVVLARYDVTLQGVIATTEGAERHAAVPARVTAAPLPLEPHTLVHVERRTIRSGDKVASEGHLIIVGDVNPGAEVIAGYNIFVWGSLKGSAYAGVPDHEEAIIAALHLAPIQLRISSYIARAPEGRPAATWMPELARVDHNTIVVETWERGRVLQKKG